MKKNIKKVILFMTVAVQFLTAITITGYGYLKDSLLEKYGTEFSVMIDGVALSDGRIEVNCYGFDSMLSGIQSDYGRYIAFTTGSDGYVVLTCTDEKPQDKCFIKTPYRFHKNNEFIRVSKYSRNDLRKIEKQLDYPVYLYERDNEKNNILNGYCSGELTNAYITVIVYNNRMKVKNVVVDGMNIDAYLDACLNGEIDLSRYDYNALGNAADALLDWAEDYLENADEEYTEAETEPQTEWEVSPA